MEALISQFSQLFSAIKDNNIPEDQAALDYFLPLICKEAANYLQDSVCTIAFFAEHRKQLTIEASSETLIHKHFSVKPPLDLEVFKKGAVIEKYNLQIDGQGIANPTRMKKQGLHALLSYAIRVKDHPLGHIGYFNYFKRNNSPFSKTDKAWAKLCANLIAFLVSDERRKLRYDYEEKLQTILNASIETQEEAFFTSMIENAKEAFGGKVAIILQANPELTVLEQIGYAGKEEIPFLKNKIIDLDKTEYGYAKELINQGDYTIESNLIENPIFFLKANIPDAQSHDLKSRLITSLIYKEHKLGLLSIYRNTHWNYSYAEELKFRAYSQAFAKTWWQYEEAQKATTKTLLEELNKTLDSVTDTKDEDETILAHTLKSISNFCIKNFRHASTAIIRLMNPKEEKLQLSLVLPETLKDKFDEAALAQKNDENFVGTVYIENKPILVQDVRQHPSLKRYDQDTGILALLLCPLRVEGQPIGTFCLASHQSHIFSQTDLLRLTFLLDECGEKIERAIFNDSLYDIFQGTREAADEQELLSIFVQSVGNLMRSQASMVWILDKNLNRFVLRDSLGLSNEQQKQYHTLPDHISHELAHASYKEQKTLTPLFEPFLPDNIIAYPLYRHKGLRGILGILPKTRKSPPRFKLEQFSTFAKQASISYAIFTERDKFRRLGEEIVSLSKVRKGKASELEKKELIDTFFEKVKSFTGIENRFLYIFDYKEAPSRAYTPHINKEIIDHYRGTQGISSVALKTECIINVPNWKEHLHKDKYVDFFTDSISMIAVPITLKNVQVRKGDKIETASKKIGILDIESPVENAFSKQDETSLDLLCNQFAVLYEAIEDDQKLSALEEFNKTIQGAQNKDFIYKELIETTQTKLGFDFAQIMLVDQQKKLIKTEYVKGSIDDTKFKSMCRHYLNSHDIQADIIRNPRIIAPASDHPLLDSVIFKEFNHKDLIRVILPILHPLTQQPIGTLEVGNYITNKHNELTEHIFERDVQLLQTLVEYAVNAIIQLQQKQIEKVRHELKEPTVSIRNNASFLKKFGLHSRLSYLKIEDILTDTDLLLNEIDKLYTAGERISFLTSAPILLFRDIIIKSLNNIKHIASQEKLTAYVNYKNSDIDRVGFYNIDTRLMNQTMLNLCMNALKYRRDDKTDLKIEVEVDDQDPAFLKIKIQDWGIGISEKDKKQVFKYGFRSHIAREKLLEGSGIGLYIVQDNMKQIGGDVKLTHLKNPTEFTLFIPKSLKT